MTSSIDNWDERSAFIVGAGGKGGGGDTPTEDPDTLRSKAEASVLAVFCEGEIQGFPDNYTTEQKYKKIYINDTPIIGPGGEDNFDDGVEISMRNGTQGQSSIPGYGDVRIEQSVGTKLIKSVGPVSATTTSSSLNRLKVRMGVGALYRVEDDGDVKGTTVKFKIEIFDSSNNRIKNDDNEIAGKTRGQYDREYEYSLSGNGPWTVRVTRLTDDAKNIRTVDDLYFKAIVGIISETLTYPNSALIGFSVSAENFQSVPTIGAELLGLKIKVPTIYNSANNTYSGVWDGSWKIEYSNNPVWVFYDLLTNPRYGCGAYINPSTGLPMGSYGILAEDIDIYALLPLAKYCDEMVPDGKGGMEKRFTFNAYINNRGDAYEVLNSLAACFRGMIYYAQGQIIATQDRAGNVVRSFSPANVVVETDESGKVTRPPFVYEGTGLKARKTVCLVSWNDKNDRYKGKVEYVEDISALERYGYREIEVRALGCTSQGQAQRLGRWTLLTNLNETETVTFRVSSEGFFMAPGEIIEVADPNKTIGIYAGISSNVTTTSIVFDREILLQDGESYELILRTNDGEEYSRAITTPAGSVSSVSFSPALPSVPDTPLAWVVRSAVVEPRKYRVLALSEDDGLVTVLASSYYAEKYDIVDSYTRLSSQITSIAGLQILPKVSVDSIVFEVT